MKVSDFSPEQLAFLEERSKDNSNWMLKTGIKPMVTETRRTVPVMKQCPICDTYFITTRIKHKYCKMKCQYIQSARTAKIKSVNSKSRRGRR